MPLGSFRFTLPLLPIFLQFSDYKNRKLVSNDLSPLIKLKHTTLERSKWHIFANDKGENTMRKNNENFLNWSNWLIGENIILAIWYLITHTIFFGRKLLIFNTYLSPPGKSWHEWEIIIVSLTWNVSTRCKKLNLKFYFWLWYTRYKSIPNNTDILIFSVFSLIIFLNLINVDNHIINIFLFITNCFHWYWNCQCFQRMFSNLN